jgi:hypothetical protein
MATLAIDKNLRGIKIMYRIAERTVLALEVKNLSGACSGFRNGQ